MTPDISLTPSDILAAFTDAVTSCGGSVGSALVDDRRLFARAVMPRLLEEVRRNDAMEGGVAIKATDEGVWLYPFLYRLVCRNGAVVSRAVESRHLEGVYTWDPELAMISIREGVQACCTPDVFAENVDRVRAGCATEIDMVLNLAPILTRMGAGSAVFSQILDRFFREGDRSRFGLANAITATARDVRDPALQWDLEELGGGVMVGSISSPPRGGRNGNRATRIGRELVAAV